MKWSNVNIKVYFTQEVMRLNLLLFFDALWVYKLDVRHFFNISPLICLNVPLLSQVELMTYQHFNYFRCSHSIVSIFIILSIISAEIWTKAISSLDIFSNFASILPKIKSGFPLIARRKLRQSFVVVIVVVVNQANLIKKFGPNINVILCCWKFLPCTLY